MGSRGTMIVEAEKEILLYKEGGGPASARSTSIAVEKNAAGKPVIEASPSTAGPSAASSLGGLAFSIQPATSPRVILADRQPWIGSDMGESARPVIEEALRALDIETRVGVSVASIDEQGATLTTGERIATATVVWCAGCRPIR